MRAGSCVEAAHVSQLVLDKGDRFSSSDASTMVTAFRVVKMLEQMQWNNNSFN